MIRQYRNYLKQIKGSRIRFALHCLLALLALIGSISTIFLFSALIDDVSAQDMDSFTHRIWLTVSVIAVSVAADYLSERILIGLQAQLGRHLRDEMQSHQLYTSLDENKSLNSGKILTTYKEQTDTIIDCTKYLQGYLIYPLTIVLACAYFITIDLRLFAVSVILMPLSSLLYGKLSVPIQKKRREIIERKARLTEQTNDVMSGFMTMKAGCQEGYFIQSYQDQMNEILKKEKEIEKINATLGRFFILIRYIPQLIIPLFGGYLAFNGQITIGELTAAGMIASYIFNPVQKLLEIKKGERILTPAIADVNQILNLTKEEILTSDIEIRPQQKSCTEIVSLKDLSFAYEQGKPVLNHITLAMKPKEHVVFIGESGSGKSTLIKAICGMLSEYDGEIYLKGNLVTKSNQAQIRSLISYIPQTIYLFHGTILDNIAMKTKYSKEEVIRAAKLARADEFIQILEHGYDTMVGDGELTLSGGQMQRIAIARGIYRNCELFLLDEPTAAVDEKNSQTIMEGLREVLKDRSSIIITHRMDVIAKEDKVMRLIGGMLYEA